MQFSTLSKYFEKLEQTSSRLILIDILSELFKETEALEIGQIVYLIQGRVAPFYEAIEIGMSEKLVAQSIARAYKVDREEVLKEYGKVGDLGLVAFRHCEEGESPVDSRVTKQSQKRDRHASLAMTSFVLLPP